MPVYEYECQSCQEIIEIWQNLTDEPVESCPSCEGQLKKIISMSSFQLKGGGWYADGYSNTSSSTCDTSKKTACTNTKKACDSC